MAALVVLHRDVYDASNKPMHRATYDAWICVFSVPDDMAADTWTKRVIGRMGRIAAMHGRDKMVAAPRTKVFGR